MVNLSSAYTRIYRFLLIIIILPHVVGIMLIKYIMPKEIAETYNITDNLIFLLFCTIIFIFSLRFNSVSFDPKNKTLTINKFNGRKMISTNDIIEVKRYCIIACKVIFKEGNHYKSTIFQPSLRMFFPLTDYPSRIREMLNDSSNNFKIF